MSDLKPCPFCGGESFIHSNRDWHSIEVNHKEGCILGNVDIPIAYANSTGQIELLVSDWNTRAIPDGDHVGDVDKLVKTLLTTDIDIVDYNLVKEAADTIQSQQAEIERLTSDLNRIGELLIASGDKRMNASDKISELQARVRELEAAIDQAFKDLNGGEIEHSTYDQMRYARYPLMEVKGPTPPLKGNNDERSGT